MVAALAVAFGSPVAAQVDNDAPVQLMLFGDASWETTEAAVPGFSLGQVVGHLVAPLSTRFSVTAEAALTSRPTGTVASLERVILRYDFSDRFRISAGRYHTPISWWNTQYHHGLWLQTSIDRPRTVRFGTPLVPVHFLGVLAAGTLVYDRVAVLYELGAGNGRQPAIQLPGDAGDANSTAAFVGGLRFRPTALPRVEFGIHGYVDEVDIGGGEIDERIIGAHVAWTRNPEIIAEYLHIVHDPEAPGAGAVSSDAYYGQIGWRPAAAPAIQPYLRLERIEIGGGDPLYTGLGLGYDGVIGGLRWDFTDFAALKGELRSESMAGGDRLTSFVLNASFVIPTLTR